MSQNGTFRCIVKRTITQVADVTFKNGDIVEVDLRQEIEEKSFDIESTIEQMNDPESDKVGA